MDVSEEVNGKNASSQPSSSSIQPHSKFASMHCGSDPQDYAPKVQTKKQLSVTEDGTVENP